MTLKGIERQYDKLTSDERFHLALDAWSRSDKTELDKIFASSPRSHYSSIENSLRSKWDAGEAIALRFSLMLSQALLNLTALNLALARKNEFKGRGVTKKLLSEKMNKQLHSAVLFMAGFRRFCKSKDINPEKLLMAWVGPSITEDLSVLCLTAIAAAI